MKKKVKILVLLLFVFISIPNSLFADIVCPTPNPDDCYDPDDYPLDTNVYYLMGLVGVAAYFKIRANNKHLLNIKSPN